MNNDLISREALKEEVKTLFCPDGYKIMMLERIDNAPTVEPFERIGSVCEENCGYRPQGKFVEILKDRIEKSVCKHCQMNKHCELCEISRVFSIIALTDKETKGDAEND